MNKKALIFLIILAAIAGGFFYFWEVWLPAQIEKEQQIPEEKTQPPTLFGKEDYKIEEREDGKYIVVEKVGLTAKVPEGWKVEFKGNDIPEPGYWITLLSPDAEVKDIPIKGCGVSIIIGEEIKNVEEVRNIIKILKEHPEIKPEEISYTYKNYILKVVEINEHEALKWIAPKRPTLGQGLGINIPLKDRKNLISFNTRLLPGYEQKCSQIWEEFLNNVEIE